MLQKSRSECTKYKNCKRSQPADQCISLNHSEAQATTFHAVPFDDDDVDDDDDDDDDNDEYVLLSCPPAASVIP